MIEPTIEPLGGPMTYEDFRAMVQEAMDKIQAKINEGIKFVADEFNRRIEAIPDWEWFAKPWLVVTVNRGVEALEAAFNSIWDEFEKQAPKIWESTADMCGNPVKLTLLSNSYIVGATLLADVGDNYLPQAIARVQDAWKEGEGPSAFGREAPKQASAALGVTAGLNQAATALGNAAETIIKSWLDAVKALLDYASKLIDAIKESTDAGQILTLEIGPALKVFLEIVVEIEKLATTLLEYVATDATAGATKWKILEGGSELSGLLAGNVWPKIAALDGREMTDRTKW